MEHTYMKFEVQKFGDQDGHGESIDEFMSESGAMVSMATMELLGKYGTGF
jgi:hypothetical protein